MEHNHTDQPLRGGGGGAGGCTAYCTPLTTTETQQAKTISSYINDLGEVLPLIIMVVIWIAILPVRLVALLLIPPGAYGETHPLHKVRDFFAFE